MTRDLEPLRDPGPTRYPVVDRRVGVRAAADDPAGPSPNPALSRVVHVRPDQFAVDGQIDERRVGFISPRGRVPGKKRVNWQDRYRTGGPREIGP